jgi:hypothetical protein
VRRSLPDDAGLARTTPREVDDRDWRHHGNPLKEANKKAVADAHSRQAEAAWP